MTSASEAELLLEVRSRIDRLDARIQALIDERAQSAMQVAEIKRRHDDGVDFYRPDREAKVLAAVRRRNRGPLPDDEVARLFREIMSACLALERKLAVCFLGPEGTFTQTAALRHFGHSIRAIPLAAIDQVFREVESGNVEYGVVPIENSTEGMVNHTLDMFLQSPLTICGEVELRIHHHLITHCEEIEGVGRIYSHQQSLAQCREWLDQHLPRVERIPVSSNGEAARLASGDKRSAAIAGESAAHVYGIPVFVGNIEDDPNNTTRFLVVGRRPVGPSGSDKTSLLVSSANRAGSLHTLLEPIARHGISMTRIESRPSRRGIWDYVFFIDMEGHREETPVAQTLAELAERASLFKVLGSYPKAAL